MKIKEYHQAVKLRKQGYSMTEISNTLRVSKSTASIWVREIELSVAAQKVLNQKVTEGQRRAAQTKRDRTARKIEIYSHRANKCIQQKKFDRFTTKLFCSLLYWCEGGKYVNTFLSFTNSDPSVVRTFLALLRRSYNLNEKKFRACIHLHSYHVALKQLNFWSDVTQFPKNQFIKPWRKAHSGKRIRADYPGCINIRYYNADVARDLLMTGKAFIEKVGA